MFKSSGFKSDLRAGLFGGVSFLRMLALAVVLFGVGPCCVSALARQAPAPPASPIASGHSARGHSPAEGKYIDVENTRLFIPDARLSDQHGNELKFYSDLVKDRIVVISLFYTSCTYICTRQGDNLSKLQALLGDRIGKDVFLISISFDPVTDTPQNIKAYASSLGAKPGWTFVTGEKEVMDEFLKDFVRGVPTAGLHSSRILIGNDRSGVWKTEDGLRPPDFLMNVIEGVTGRQPERPKAGG